jgi:hypothetical protein
VIPEIDIWRAANLMLKHYGDKAREESATRADELAAPATAMAPQSGAGSPLLSASAPTTLRPDRCTDRNVFVTTRDSSFPSRSRFNVDNRFFQE